MLEELLLQIAVIVLLLLVVGWFTLRSELKEFQEQTPGVVLPDPDSPEETQKDKLERLQELLDGGIITSDEYQERLREIRSED